MESIVFKRADESDVADILRITKKSFTRYAAEIGHSNIAALSETEGDVLSDLKNKYVYICRMDGETVGSVRVEIMKDKIAYLSRLAIEPEMQALGVGGLLLEKVRQECAKLDLNAIALFTASKMRSTVAFYLKNGYYIHNITKDKSYIRALMVNELNEMDEMYDYQSLLKDK